MAEPFEHALTLRREANRLVMPTLDAANITFNVLKATSGRGITIGPLLLGLASPAHVLTPTASVRRIVNMSALASVDVAAHQCWGLREGGTPYMAWGWGHRPSAIGHRP